MAPAPLLTHWGGVHHPSQVWGAMPLSVNSHLSKFENNTRYCLYSLAETLWSYTFCGGFSSSPENLSTLSGHRGIWCWTVWAGKTENRGEGACPRVLLLAVLFPLPGGTGSGSVEGLEHSPGRTRWVALTCLREIKWICVAEAYVAS